MRNILLVLRFDGTAYHGWQMQKNAPSVCGAVSGVLEGILGHRVSLLGCGRTDARVHAERYVANVRTEARIDADSLQRALKARLPDDIVCLGAREAEERFHAIASCTRKEYVYRILTSPLRDPFRQNRAWHCARPLDIGAMTRAAGHMIGTRDFGAMRCTGTKLKSTVRTVYHYDVSKRGELLELRVCADGFLYNMARVMAGTLVYAGEGRIAPEDIPSILESGDRTKAGPTAPPEGLYMTRLWYGEEEFGGGAGQDWE